MDDKIFKILLTIVAVLYLFMGLAIGYAVGSIYGPAVSTAGTVNGEGVLVASSSESVYVTGVRKFNSSQTLSKKAESPPLIRIVTAYNTLPGQTDSEPCISANGEYVCGTDKTICASNEFAFGTILKIGDITCRVADRTNSRYSYRIDILMASYQEAIIWGRQEREIIILQ